MLSKIWMIPWSVTNDGIPSVYASSLVIFDEPVDAKTAEAIADKGRVMFETIDLMPEEEDSIVQAMRSTFG